MAKLSSSRSSRLRCSACSREASFSAASCRAASFALDDAAAAADGAARDARRPLAALLASSLLLGGACVAQAPYIPLTYTP